MTAHQQSKLNDLAREFQSVGVREDSHSRSIFVDVYDHGLPERCVECGSDDSHLGADHSFKVAHPVATFRISPSGFTQNLTPVAA